MAKPKKSAWFVKVRGSYLPRTWPAILLYLAYVGYLIFVLVYAVKTQDTVTRAALFIFPQWVAAFAIITWVAGKKS